MRSSLYGSSFDAECGEECQIGMQIDDLGKLWVRVRLVLVAGICAEWNAEWGVSDARVEDGVLVRLRNSTVAYV